MSFRPWDVYAQQLLPLGYGFPLWRPGSKDNGREVLIGDVGWIKNGQFRAFFNTMHHASGSVNAPLGVPDSFEILDPSTVLIKNYGNEVQQIIYSRSLYPLDNKEVAGGRG